MAVDAAPFGAALLCSECGPGPSRTRSTERCEAKAEAVRSGIARAMALATAPFPNCGPGPSASTRNAYCREGKAEAGRQGVAGAVALGAAPFVRRRRQSDRRILGSSAPNALRARLGPGVNLRSMFSHWLWAPGPKTTSPRLRRAQPTGARWRACGGLAEFASRCFRRSPRRSSSQRHRSGVGFAFRKIGAWRRGRRGSLHAEEERAVRRPGQGRSARFCASSTATSAARHEPVAIIEA